MSGSSKITADYSSIVGLKAELLRKRLEAQELKNKNPIQNVAKQYNKPKVKEIKIKKESSPKVIEIEDINLLKKSKMMLEAKSRLYEKLKNSPRNKNDLFLVDFSNKSNPESENSDSDEEFTNKTKDIKKENEEEFTEQNYDSDDDFVEYQDCFGRTRKCLREDLPKMQEKDSLLRQKISKEPVTEKSPETETKKPESPQREPEIEIMRKKWEEQTNRLADKDNIYYQDVLFDEARTHGVGYYNFSIDEEERAKQQENLEKLRKETEQKQQEMQHLKEMRQKMEKNRLRVARIRQRIRAGLPPELPEDEDNTPEDAENPEPDNSKAIGEIKEESSKNDRENKEESSNQVTDKEDSLADIEDKVRAFGELLGKRPHWREMSQEEWVDKRRKDRLNEFAPCYDNFQSAGFLKSENQDAESDDSEVIGPMPFDPSLSNIPLPPPKESTSNPSVSGINSKTKNSIDSSKIEAGLKYLRAKFEEKDKY